MTLAHITHFNQAVEPSFDQPREDRRVSGAPWRTTWAHYTSSDGVLSCGIWACEVGSWNIRFAPDKEEFFCVISGQVRLLDEQGQGVVVSAGEAAVIPAGFVGRFEVLQAVRKYFVVLDRSASTS
ncbi:cupin domain-containing protein [Chitinibacter sp. GC72]|uniref:cupin domain-containing protein n=1 Tax=Chitinibacter sp. GC72 TaxID=1526917 RepID=UPI0012FBF73A|nr:cupin domain-containing protein [Chitinibacter sp. GC72]